ncbi:putative oxidoreductase [Flavobacterium sp. W4I14]|nr:putative oxidoreductase [Flavobacterium sp. W4I14]
METITCHKKTAWLADIGLALLVLLWLYTGISKIFEYHHFVFQMGLSPATIVSANKNLLGWLIPFVELALALMLLLSKSRKLGLGLSILLLMIFEIYIVSMLSNGHLPCACGGVVGKLSWKGHVVFNAFYLLIAIGVFFEEYPRVRKRE